ncbi:Sister chromatid cohesion protein PDS5-like B-B, partial [Mucuna pruriens]
KLELLLSTLDQAPNKPIQESLVPSMTALISDELLKHTDEDVKISVTSCITQITRITAPDVPYDDKQMKEVFNLTVKSFGKLSHISGRGYEKALNILDNVNKVRLCLVMLDLECDDLVIEMFQHFLRCIRSNHPSDAIHSMESIMTLILQESEQISSDLLRPLLDSVRNENQSIWFNLFSQTISPISWTLGEKVITNCAVKLKPYLAKAVESSGRALNEYALIVTEICQNESESAQCDGFEKRVSLSLIEVRIGCVAILQVQEAEHKLDVPKDTEEQPCDVNYLLPFPMILNLTDKLESVQEPKSEIQLDTVPRRRDRKPNSLMNAEEGYDNSWIYRGTKPEKSALSRKARNCSSAFPSSEKSTSRKDKFHRKPKTVSKALVSEQKSENIAKPAHSRRTHNIGSDFPPNDNPASSKDRLLSKPEDTSEGREALASKPKTYENTDAAPSMNNNIPDGCSIKQGQPRKINSTGNQDVHSDSVSVLKEDNLNHLLEETSLDSPAVRLEKESEVGKDSELKPIRKLKLSVKVDGKVVAAPESEVAKMEPNVSCGDEGKHKSSMNVELEHKEEGRSSAQTDVKKRRRLNATLNKDLNKSSAVKELIAESASKTLSDVKETAQARLRRRHITVGAEATESRADGNSLVGSRIKVWWPKDKTFYEGVIESYDHIKGKHKILYADGDVEVLNLKRQRWEVVAVDVPLDEEGLALQKLAEASDIVEFFIMYRAEKGQEKSELESAKDANINSQSSKGRASASISKSVDTSAVDRSDLVDDSPITFGGKDSARKPKTKRMKTGSDIKKNKRGTDDLEKEKVQVMSRTLQTAQSLAWFDILWCLRLFTAKGLFHTLFENLVSYRTLKNLTFRVPLMR